MSALESPSKANKSKPQVIQSIRGMNDILPDEMAAWQFLEQAIRQVVASYGYQEIRTPEVEKTALFSRAIGDVTDIVEKEMYTFDDRNGDSLSLRPEGTAGFVRAGIEHGLFYNQVQRLWYLGSMFRHERPQKGRYRRFFQFGAEVVGLPGPDVDAELILMSARLWQTLGIQDKLTLQINSLGSLESRAVYREKLVQYFTAHRSKLDADSERRLQSNPLRILDSKHPDMQPIIKGAPHLGDYLDAESRAHFDALLARLEAAGLAYEINPHLVRGLDYYVHGIYEWVTDALGAQGTVCAGGRYDGLIGQLGGRETPATGFAMGLERAVALLSDVPSNAPHAYMVLIGEAAEQAGLLWAEKLRDRSPDISVLCHGGGGSVKSQFKRADKSGARFALVLDDEGLASETLLCKDLRGEQAEQRLKIDELVSILL